MARNLSSRMLVKGTLVAVSPIHVGGISLDPEIDLALAIDGQGRFYVPGTSFAGVLRAWMEKALGDGQEAKKTTTDFLWGAVLKETKQPNHASFIMVEDAPIAGAIAEVRDGVGIDRILGAAAERVKYDQAILPKGTKIPLDMTVELAESSLSEESREQVLELLRDVLISLKHKKLRLGASKTRGMGRVKLQELSICEQTLNTRDGMLQALKQQGTGLAIADLSTQSSLNPRPTLDITINWHPVGSLMVKSESDGITVDHLPLVSAVDTSNLAFVLPGSSIKGALRTQAERIVRTIRQRPVPDSGDLSHRFMEQLEEYSLITTLFGCAAKVGKNSEPDKKPTQLGYVGALSIDDCYAKSEHYVDSQVWRSIEGAKTSKDLYEALKVQLPATQQGFHVAIDRWTGGAADGLLYSTLEPMGIQWEPITLTLDFTQLQNNKADKSIAFTLLLLVLRDMMAGRIPLGYGTNRGMGAIAVNHIQIQGHDLPSEWSSLQDITLDSTNFKALDADLMRSLQTAWTEWINAPSDDESNVEVTA